MNCVPLAVGHYGAVTQPAGMTSRPVIGGRHVDVPVGISTVLTPHCVNHLGVFRDLGAGIAATRHGWQSPSPDSVMAAGITSAPHKAM